MVLYSSEFWGCAKDIYGVAESISTDVYYTVKKQIFFLDENSQWTSVYLSDELRDYVNNKNETDKNNFSKISDNLSVKRKIYNAVIEYYLNTQILKSAKIEK